MAKRSSSKPAPKKIAAKSSGGSARPTASRKRTAPVSALATREAEPTSLPTHEEISQRAHELWVDRGRLSGQDREIWCEAERQLMESDA